MNLAAIAILVLGLSWLLAPLVKTRCWNYFIVLGVSLCLLFFGCYHLWGNSEQLKKWNGAINKQQRLTRQFRELGTPDEIMERLEARLAAHPNDPRGWFLLGKLHYTQQNYTKARDALKRAYALNPTNPALTLQFAQALLFADGERAQPQVELLLNTTLSQEPDNLTALNLLGLVYLNQERMNEAIEQWQKIVSILPENDPGALEYQEAIVRAISSSLG